MESCEFFIYFGDQTLVGGIIVKYIFLYGWFPFHFADVFLTCAEFFFLLMKSHLFILSIMSLDLGDISVKILQRGMSEIFRPMFSSERERRREREREEEKHQLVASFLPPNGDPAYNPGMYSDRELNRWPFSLQASAQFTEPHQSGQNVFLYFHLDEPGPHHISLFPFFFPLFFFSSYISWAQCQELC